MNVVTKNDLDQLESNLVDRMRVELMALHLGDDMLIDEDTAAQLLNISPKTLYRMRVAGEVPHGYIGTKPRYALGQIRALMRKTINDR